MKDRKRSARTAAPQPIRKPRRTSCKLSLVEEPIQDAPPIAPLPPAPPPSPPRRRFRTPHRCTLGAHYYDERRGDVIVGRPVPMLRLTGRWLEQCGFAVGDDLKVTVGRGMLLVSRRK